MQFRIEAEQLVKAKDQIKKVVLNSSIVKKTIYLKATDSDELILYAYSEGNYGEIHVPAQVKKEGFVELSEKSLDRFDGIKGMVSFELSGNQILYDMPSVEGEINIQSDEPDFNERDKPVEWVTLPKEIFKVLYCHSKDDNNLNNAFFSNDIIACTSQHAFAGYKHSERLVQAGFTVPMAFFDLADKEKIENFDIAFDVKRIWFKSGGFYVASSTRDYTNPIVTEYGYYDFDPLGKPFFEISIEQAKQLCGYASAISEEGRAALVLEEGILTIIPTGSELGKGTMKIKCKSSFGQMNYGASVGNLLNAVTHVDAATCKAYHLEPQGTSFLLIDGTLTRHMFGEIPSARMVK